MFRRFGRFTAAIGVALSVTFLAPVDVDGQTLDSVEGSWTAWYGCWEPIAEELPFPFLQTEEAEAIYCVIPGDQPQVAELLTFVEGEGSAPERQTLDATGARHPFERDGCTGWESMEFAADGRRVYQNSEYECPGPFRRTMSGIISIAPGGFWISVQGISAAEATDVRVVGYRPVPASRVASAEVSESLTGLAMQIDAARVGLSASAGIDEVIVVSRDAAPAVVEAWLIEQGHGFDLDAERLIALDDAGVPGSVIDIMVALSNPDVFAIDRSAREGSMRPSEPSAAPVTTAYRPNVWRFDPFFDPWYYDPWYSDRGLGFGYSTRYGLYGRPVVIPVPIIPGDLNQSPVSRTRVVNGRGYTRGGAAQDVPSPSSGSSSTTQSSPSTGSASSGSSSSGSSGSSAPVRTARPRSGS